jgi:hypothetical protein
VLQLVPRLHNSDNRCVFYVVCAMTSAKQRICKHTSRVVKKKLQRPYMDYKQAYREGRCPRSRDGCAGLDELFPYSVRQEYVEAKVQGRVRSRLETNVAVRQRTPTQPP